MNLEFTLYFVSKIHGALTWVLFQVVFSNQNVMVAASFAINAVPLRVCGELLRKSV